MMNVYIIVEGQTEEIVVGGLLEPHFTPLGIYLHPIIVKTSLGHRGGGKWKQWKNDIHRVLREQK